MSCVWTHPTMEYQQISQISFETKESQACFSEAATLDTSHPRSRPVRRNNITAPRPQRWSGKNLEIWEISPDISDISSRDLEDAPSDLRFSWQMRETRNARKWPLGSLIYPWKILVFHVFFLPCLPCLPEGMSQNLPRDWRCRLLNLAGPVLGPWWPNDIFLAVASPSDINQPLLGIKYQPMTGWWARAWTPLKNDGLRQLGSWHKFPIFLGKGQIDGNQSPPTRYIHLGKYINPMKNPMKNHH